MDHLPQKKKKLKIFSVLGVLTLVLGVFITLQATQQNNDTRNRAQVPNSYPNSYPTQPPGENIPNVPDLFVTGNVRIAASDFKVRVGNVTYTGNAPYDIKSFFYSDILQHNVKWVENNTVINLNFIFKNLGGISWELDGITTEIGPLNGSSKYIYYVDESGTKVSGYFANKIYTAERKFRSYNSADNAEITCNNCVIEPFRNERYTARFPNNYTMRVMHGFPEGKPFRLQPGYGRGNIVAILKHPGLGILREGDEGIQFDWVADAPDLLTITKNPNPQRGYYSSEISLTGNKFGKGVITVYARDFDTPNHDVVAAESFPFEVVDSIEESNPRVPSCSIGVYADNAASVPPNYIITQKISKVEPGQTVVVAANFFNKTYKSYQNASNHVTLGPLFAFKDSNGKNCNVNSTANTLECDHGLFMDGGASSVAFRVKYLGAQAAPATIFGTTFTSNGDTGSCSTTVNAIPVVAQ